MVRLSTVVSNACLTETVSCWSLVAMADFFIDKTILSPRYKQESSYGLRIAFFRRVIIIAPVG